VSFPYRRPRIAWEAEGLFHALDAEDLGDASPLERWMGAGYAALRESLRRSGFRGALADDAASAVVTKAYRWFRGGHAVRNERAWMASVAFHYAVDEARARRRFQERVLAPLSLSLVGEVSLTPPATT